MKNRLKTKVKFRHRNVYVFQAKLLKISSPEPGKTLSLYWYLQYFAALGLFASIHLWVSNFHEFPSNFGIENQANSNNNEMKNSLGFF